MKLSQPIPWRDVPPGVVVLHFGKPALVVHRRNDPAYGTTHFMIEGHPEWIVTAEAAVYLTTQLVQLDDTDAVATLAAAGLHPEIIDITYTDTETE